jgi:hypothetical protein
MENNYYNLCLTSGKVIIERRQRILDNDRVPNPRFYDLDIDPNKMYMASIIYEDITDLTSIYIEEIIYEFNK